MKEIKQEKNYKIRIRIKIMIYTTYDRHQKDSHRKTNINFIKNTQKKKTKSESCEPKMRRKPTRQNGRYYGKDLAAEMRTTKLLSR